MIRRKRADTYVHRLYCDLCGHEMKATGPQPQPIAGQPPEFIHRCSNEPCTHTETITGKTYPAIDYHELGEEIGQQKPPEPEQDPEPQAG